MPASNANIIAVATGNLLPSTFASWTVDGVVELGVVQSDGTLPIAGIVTEATRDPLATGTLYAAIAGESVLIYASESDDPYLKLGANVSSSELLKSDGSGFGIPVDLTSTSKQYCGARAMMNGLSGYIIRVKPHIVEIGKLA